MLKRSVLLLLLLMILPWIGGCAIIEPMQAMSHETWRSLRPRGSDYRDSTADVDDEWSAVGKEARGDQPMSKGGDPWYSSKARNIERNLGVGL